LNQQDCIERICKQIGEWSKEAIEEAENHDVVHNLTMNTRFLFKYKRVTICNISHCPMPFEWSAGGTAESGEDKLVSQYNGDSGKYGGIKELEDLFRDVQMLESTDFTGLKIELKEILEECTSNNQGNYMLAHKIEVGQDMLEELQKTEEATPDILMEYMANSILARERHRRYLDQVKEGVVIIRNAKLKHQETWRRLPAPFSLLFRALLFPNPLRSALGC